MAEGPQALDQPDKGRRRKSQLLPMSSDVPDDNNTDLLEDDAGTTLAAAKAPPQESPYHLILVPMGGMDDLRHRLSESVLVSLWLYCSFSSARTCCCCQHGNI